MKNMPILPNMRNRERGAVAIVVAFTWTALFGAAVLAIDFGYLYAKRRGLQAAADGLLKVSMPDWVSGYPNGFSQATYDATNRATSFGFTAAEVSTSQDTLNRLFSVKVSRTFPTFIGGVFGLNGKTVSATATGQMSASTPAAAILALGGAASIGVRISGDTTLNITGDVQSNGPLEMCGGPSKPYTTTGNVQAFVGTPMAPSVCSAMVPPIPGYATWDVVTGTVGTVGTPFTDPFATALPVCTVGSMFAPLAMPAMGPGPACPAGNCYIAPGIYCSSAAIAINPTDPCNCIQTDPAGAGVTFISSGPITIGGSGGVYLKAYNSPQNPNKIIFWTTSTASPAFNFGGSALPTGPIQFDGAIYAPAGRINMGSQDPMTVNGSIVGLEVMLGLGTVGPFNINGNGSGGGGGGGWKLYR